jgi:amino acid adenylation domain-containing protein
VRFLLQDLLSEAADRDPDRIAIRCLGRSLTYGELESASNGLARTLISGGVEPGDRVGIHLPKRVEIVTAVYGALKAGAAYVPLDPKAPVGRIGGIAADCSISALVTTPARASALLRTLSGRPPKLVISVEDGTEASDLTCASVPYRVATTDEGSIHRGVKAIDTDLAYILYTSGSTGVPKGVMLTHRHALNFVEWSASRIGIESGDRLSNHAPLHFDLSVFDLFLACRGGATVVLVPEEIAYLAPDIVRFIQEEQITVWYSVPSALVPLTRVLTGPGALTSLRAVVFAGEVFPTKYLRALRRLVPNADLWNLYGPTETNVCTYYRVDQLPDDDQAIPIGRPCENTHTFALRTDGSVAGIGGEGELYVRGSCVMKGYWGQPEKTAAVLVQNPLAPHLPEPVYRTGDVVRLRADGAYDFLGRRDNQIKSRGFRVELGEIEVALNAHPSVGEAVVVAVPHEEWGKAIVAWIVPKNDEAITSKQMKQHIAERLPRYMVPAKVEIVSELPRTSTGKIDRQGVVEASAVDSRAPGATRRVGQGLL